MRLPDMDYDPRDYSAAFLEPACEVVDRRIRGFKRADGRSDRPQVGARYQLPCRPASSTEKRGRAGPGWFASRLPEPEDGWRTNGGARAAWRFRAGRARRAYAPSPVARCAAKGVRLSRRRTAGRRA